MRALAEKHRDDLVIFIGKEGAADLAESYGFENAVTAEDFHHEFPCVFPAPVQADADRDERVREQPLQFRRAPALPAGRRRAGRPLW